VPGAVVHVLREESFGHAGLPGDELDDRPEAGMVLSHERPRMR
jgi:hypothetical protein